MKKDDESLALAFDYIELAKWRLRHIVGASRVTSTSVGLDKGSHDVLVAVWNYEFLKPVVVTIFYQWDIFD